MKYKPAVLLVFDGFGVAEPSEFNAISEAKTPFFDTVIQEYPTVLVEAAGASVGLPFGEVGNSEVGHYNIGSGQLLYQSLPRINNSIKDGSFFEHEVLQRAIAYAQSSGKKIHLLGLIGAGGVHAHQSHLQALIELCHSQELSAEQVVLHAFLDGRDSAPDAAISYVKDLEEEHGKKYTFATMAGRFYAMDRNNKWDRTETTYNAIVQGQSQSVTDNPITFLEQQYKQEVFDEEIPSTVLQEDGKARAQLEDGDVLIFFNFRADRARQLTEALILPNFVFFERKRTCKDLIAVTFTEYKKGLPVHILYPPQVVKEPLAYILSKEGYKQYHIAETEKYAHVTFFFNGLLETSFEGEERVLIPSPAVTSYDEKPEMSAHEVTDTLIEALDKGEHDFYLANFANGDMVGHTGNLEASIQAVEVLDQCYQKIVEKVLEKDGIVFLTSDHGNVEELFNKQTYKINKEHSVYPVPFIVISNKHKGKVVYPIKSKKDLAALVPSGILANVAPTILANLGIPKVKNMLDGLSELVVD